MNLTFKSDFDRVALKWQNWWNSNAGTAPMIVSALPLPGAVPAPDPMQLVEGDIDEFGDRLEKWAETHTFPEDTVPGCVLSFGADHFAAMLGAEMTVDYANRTTWITPCVDDWNQYEIKVDWNSRIAARTLECARKLRRRFDGKLLISPTHLQGNLDCLAALRGVQPLLFDLIDSPDQVKRALDQVNEAFAEVIKVFREEFDTDSLGSINRHGLYCKGINGLLQCDFSCMINPEMLAEFVLPSLEFEADAVDYAEYHLDGPGAIVHVEALSQVKGIKVIQYQPGAAKLNDDWRELYRKIDDLGVGQFFWRPSKELVDWICSNLSNRRTVLDLLQLETSSELEEYKKIIGR